MISFFAPQSKSPVYSTGLFLISDYYLTINCLHPNDLGSHPGLHRYIEQY